MSKEGAKFGIYLPPDLARDLEVCMRVLGIESKSKFIQEALRSFINENRWRLGGRVIGIIGVIYDHEVGSVDEELTDIQHEYLDIIASTIHVHIDKRRCMLGIMVKGDVSKVKELLSKIMNIRGVLHAKPLLLSVEESHESTST